MKKINNKDLTEFLISVKYELDKELLNQALTESTSKEEWKKFYIETYENSDESEEYTWDIHCYGRTEKTSEIEAIDFFNHIKKVLRDNRYVVDEYPFK